jgi:hypothetical protein
MKVVLGGSRHLHFIPQDITEKLTDWIHQSSDFLVGDAPGIDRAFQQFLESRKYNSVTVYTSANEVRNNLGKWAVERIESGLKSKSSAVHAFKDRKMSRIADIGLMIWDCESAGTLSNVIDLVKQGKNCFVWVSPDSDLYQFDNLESLESWMSIYSDVRDEALSRLRTFERREIKRDSKQDYPKLFNIEFE